MGCHPNYPLTFIFFRGVGIPPTRIWHQFRWELGPEGGEGSHRIWDEALAGQTTLTGRVLYLWWFLDGYLKKLTWMWEKNTIKVDHVLWVSWSFMEMFMVFPHLALKNHHIFRSIPMCVTYFTGPATFPRCPGRNHGPSPRVRFVRWSPRALPGGDSWIDAATKCGSFPMKKVDLPIKTIEINHDLLWFTMIFPSKSIQMVEINYDLPSKNVSFTANNEESCGFPHEKWWFFQQTCRCA